MDAEDTLAPAIASQLRREILRGSLPAGAPVKERDNAARLGVSRTPLREAIRILANEGLIQLRPLRSPIVADPPLDILTDQIRVLRMLELLAGELACARATSDDLRIIADLKDQVARIYDKADTLDVFELDMQFHSAIVAASHNAALIATHCEYLRRLWRARYLSSQRHHSRAKVMAQHDAIVDGLIARDITGVQGAIAAHLDDMQANIRDHFHETPAPPAQTR